MKGRVSVCAWERTTDGYRVWVRSRPHLSAAGPTFESADEALGEAIGMETSDGENVREYIPRRPARLSSFIHRVVSHPAGWGHAYVGNAESLYEEGVCDSCGKPRGARSGAAIELERVESGYDGVITRYPSGWEGGHLYAESFLALLTPEERDAGDWRPVFGPPRARKRFYELVATRVHAPLVAVRGWKDPVRHCATCGRDFMPAYDVPPDPLLYVATDAVGTADCFSFGDPGVPVPMLAIGADRWQQIAGSRGTRGIQSIDVGIIGPEQVARTFARVPA